MVGALSAGVLGDRIGRRKLMLANIAFFSVGMGATAMATSVEMFGAFRFVTGIGIGSLVATAGALVAEFAPRDKRNLLNAIVYSGVPAGGVLAAVLAIATSDAFGWRGLFWVGALPIVFLLPVAYFKLPESPGWLQARGHLDRAQVQSQRTGIPLAVAPDRSAASSDRKVGFAALASRRYALPTALLGLMSFSGLLLTYGLNTWLPEIMGQYGYGKSYSLLFLLVLNLGAIVGGLIASRSADRFGVGRMVATTFAIAAISLVLLAIRLPLPVLLLGVAIAGLGTIGTQVLVYGLVSNYYETMARAAGVSWCAGFGRLGGIVGPILGGLLIGAGVSTRVAFFIFAGIALAGAFVTLLVPRSPVAEPEVTQREADPAPVAP